MKANSANDNLGYDDKADTEKLRGIANGDRTSFRELVDRYDGLLFAAIQHVLNDRSDSEEVLQEVLFSLWQKAHLYHPDKGRPVTWLSSMARNRAIDRLRKKQRQSRIRESYHAEVGVVPRVNIPISGYEAAIRRDQCYLVSLALNELTEVQREAIDLYYLKGMSQLEIANQLGEPLGTIKARVRRGMQRLRVLLDRKSN